jgi:hypothetical protein
MRGSNSVGSCAGSFAGSLARSGGRSAAKSVGTGVLFIRRRFPRLLKRVRAHGRKGRRRLACLFSHTLHLMQTHQTALLTRCADGAAGGRGRSSALRHIRIPMSKDARVGALSASARPSATAGAVPFRNMRYRNRHPRRQASLTLPGEAPSMESAESGHLWKSTSILSMTT